MKKITTIFFIFISYQCFCQYSFEFNITSDEDIVLNHCIEDNEGNFIFVGSIGDYNTKNYDAYIVKIYPGGNYSTKRINRKDTISAFLSIVLLEDGNCMAIGCFDVDTLGWYRRNIWFCKIDTELNVISENQFKIDSTYYQIAPAFAITDWNEDIVITGQVASWNPAPPYSQTDLFFIKINQQADTILTKFNSDQGGGESIYGIELLQDSMGYYFVGSGLGYFSMTHYTTLSSDLVITSIKDFDKYLGNPSMGPWLTDTTFLCSGLNGYDSKQKNDQYVHVMIVDTNALVQNELILNKHIGLDDYSAWVYSNAYINDTTIYIGGFTTTSMPWVTEPSIIELFMIDSDLNLLGYNEYGGDANYQLIGIFPASDGGCLLYSHLFDNMQGIPERDIHIIKILRDDINIITSVESIEPTYLKANVWPNPVGENLFIRVDQYDVPCKLLIKLYDSSGKRIINTKLFEQGNTVKIEVTNLKSGTYLYHIEDNFGRVHNGKFIKQ